MIAASRRGALPAAICLLAVLASPLAAAKAKPKKPPPPDPVTMVFDLHSDTVYQGVEKNWDLAKNKGSVDLEKLDQGNYLAQTFALWTPPLGQWSYLEKLHHVFEKWMAAYGADMEQARDAGEILAAHDRGKVAAVLAIEGLAPLGDDPEKIRTIYGWGVRIMGLTWWKSNGWSGSSTDPDPDKHGGLTENGRKAVAIANELGMIIDVSHASDQAVRDVAEISLDPFVASHSCAAALVDIPRNLSDEMLALIASKGGVVGVNFHVGFLSADPQGSVKRKAVVDNVMHMVSVMGADHVALGSDFDGAKTPMGLKHAGQMQALARDLLDRGLTQEEVDGIMYKNALRIFAEVTGEGAAPAGLLSFLSWPKEP